ncbi:hypothetical protein NPH96_004322 [Klebsiella variicola]|nr:hypothetical protein [Klebsiella variicola]
MTIKIERLNGFEYHYEKHQLGGSWVYYWYFRPVGQNEWCNFYLPTGNAKKADMISFLKNPEDSAARYKSWFETVSNVENAELNLSRARAQLERVSDPDWGGRGNNPDKDARRKRQALYDVDCALRKLEKAKRIRQQITK